MWVIDIDVLEQNQHDYDTNWLREHLASGANPQRRRVQIEVSGPWNMVGKIKDLLRSEGRIGRLRIFGHGTEGLQAIGSGSKYDPLRSINLGSLGPGGPCNRLCGLFDPGGWVEFHGCRVAQGLLGQNLVEQLAILWQVPVKAGVGGQWVRPGFEGEFAIARPVRGGATYTRTAGPR